MHNYSLSKKYDDISKKNIDENEERNETTSTAYFDLNCVSIKNIHNKRKEYR